MKKFLVLALVFGMAAAAVGCGSSSSASTVVSKTSGK